MDGCTWLHECRFYSAAEDGVEDNCMPRNVPLHSCFTIAQHTNSDTHTSFSCQIKTVHCIHQFNYQHLGHVAKNASIEAQTAGAPHVTDCTSLIQKDIIMVIRFNCHYLTSPYDAVCFQGLLFKMKDTHTVVHEVSQEFRTFSWQYKEIDYTWRTLSS